jgi:hypothetical protein
MAEIDQTIGALREAVNTLKDEVTKLRVDVSNLGIEIAAARGRWRTVSAISAGLATLITAGVIKFGPVIGILPK